MFCTLLSAELHMPLGLLACELLMLLLEITQLLLMLPGQVTDCLLLLLLDFCQDLGKCFLMLGKNISKAAFMLCLYQSSQCWFDAAVEACLSALEVGMHCHDIDDHRLAVVRIAIHSA